MHHIRGFLHQIPRPEWWLLAHACLVGSSGPSHADVIEDLSRSRSHMILAMRLPLDLACVLRMLNPKKVARRFLLIV